MNPILLSSPTARFSSAMERSAAMNKCEIGLARPTFSRPFRHSRTDPIMDFSALLRIAMRALARNKLRSVLTMLGIIVGVGAVIAMLAVGEGGQKAMQQQIQAVGSEMLFVGGGTGTAGGVN